MGFAGKQMVTNTHGLFLTECWYWQEKGSDPQEKKRLLHQAMDLRQHQNKVHAVRRGHQSSGYKDPEKREEFYFIPENQGTEIP